MNGYGWVEAWEAYAFTVVLGIAEDDVIRRLGGDPGRCEHRTFDECFWIPETPQWVQIGQVGPGVLVAENNGWRANEDDTAVPLSRGGQVVSFYRNVNAVMRFIYAADGVLLSGFDPLLDERPKDGCDARCLDPYLTGLPFGLDAAEPCAMELLERVTGVRVDPAWLSAPQRAFALPPLR
ncbi:MAG TPA: DUF6461 domain-containing protein [Micromonosporaceae bacterium]